MSKRNLLYLLLLSSVSTIHPAKPKNKEYFVTEVKTEKLTYDWIFKNFELLPQENKKKISSPIFYTEDKEIGWELKLYPRGKNTSDISHVSLYLNFHSVKASEFYSNIHCNFTILRGNEVVRTRQFNSTSRNSSVHGFPQFIERSKLLNSAGPVGNITIRCDIDMPRTLTESFEVIEPMEQEMLRDLEKGGLIEDFSRLFEDRKFTDAVLVAGMTTVKFPVHRNILSSRSSMFAEAFGRTDVEGIYFNETQPDVKVIEAMEPAVVNATLEFIYTDDVADLETHTLGLLEAAKRFKLPRLRNMCERILYRKLNEGNAVEMLNHTHHYGSLRFKEYIMEFIGDHLSVVEKTEGYGKMQNEMYSKLWKEFQGKILKNNSQC